MERQPGRSTRRGPETLTALVAARAVEPPLSVGLFGAWGSGKSFLIRQIQRQVRELARRSRSSPNPAHYAHVRNIEFNAWHYAEADVLSSLVDHVFNRLDLGEGTGDTYQTSLAAAETQLAKAGLAAIIGIGGAAVAQGRDGGFDDVGRGREVRRPCPS